MKRIIFLLIILILISGCFPKEEVIDKKTTQCIASKSTLYISTGCLACAKQEELFGDNFQYLNIIDCKQDPSLCLNNNILKVPTWIINEQKIEGVQSEENLKNLTGCLEDA